MSMDITISEAIYRKALQISTSLWNHPEVGDEERASASLLVFNAASYGFRTAGNLDGIPTAFLAAWDTEGKEDELQLPDPEAAEAADAEPGLTADHTAPASSERNRTADNASPASSERNRNAGEENGAATNPSHIPTVAFLAEYDALPGYEDLSPDGSGNAHACGHNWIAAASFAAAVSLKEAAEREKKNNPAFRARILFIGTPAEETWGAKIKMAEDGVFTSLGIDAAFECHLSGQKGLCFSSCMLAQAELHYTFHGKASHAAAHPENGVNALDAMNLTFQGIACLRQHVLPDTKLHGIILEGGTACNIVPDHTVMDYYIRCGKKDYLENVVERVNNCARGGALMTGCTVDIQRNRYTFYDMKNNSALVEKALEKLPAAAREAAAADFLGEEEREGLLEDAAVQRKDSIFQAVSGDMGNVSYSVPSFYGVFGVSPVSRGADVHDRAFVPVVDSAYAHALIKEAALVMARTAGEVLADADFRQAVRDAFAGE